MCDAGQDLLAKVIGGGWVFEDVSVGSAIIQCQQEPQMRLVQAGVTSVVFQRTVIAGMECVDELTIVDGFVS